MAGCRDAVPFASLCDLTASQGRVVFVIYGLLNDAVSGSDYTASSNVTLTGNELDTT